MKNILCTVCARGGSVSLKNKNFRKLLNIPLITRTLIQAHKTKIFDKIVVSSDSNKILKISKKYSDFNIKRPKKLSNSKSSKISAIKHALMQSEKTFKKKFEIIIDLDVTAPLRTKNDIIKAKKKFINKKYKNLISVCYSNKNPYFNMVEKTKKGLNLVKKIKTNVFSRQEAPRVFEINAALYIWKRSCLIKAKKVVNNSTGLYLMPKSRSVDIDTLEDFKLVEYYMKRK